MKKTIILFLLFFIILSACIPKSSTVNPNILSQNEPTPRVDTQHVNAEKQYLAVGSEIILEPSISLEAFTIENPVLDNAHITEILKKLQAKFLSQFADAGWYFFQLEAKKIIGFICPVQVQKSLTVFFGHEIIFLTNLVSFFQLQ